MSPLLVLSLGSVILLAWVGMALFRGWFWLVRAPGTDSEPVAWPAVVAVVPARDEASVIGDAITSLLQQHYPGLFHVILVDDHSTDATVLLAQQAAARLGQQARLTVAHARKLPPGWMGKVWAQAEGLRVQQELFPEARYVWLTDADIAHDHPALRRLVARAEAGNLVLASLMVRLRCVSLAEKALVPAFVFFFAMLYPFSRVNDPGSSVAAAAGGCMLVRTDDLAAIGGMGAIKNALIDDCALARRLKRHGAIRLDFAQASYSLRAYDWPDLWNMIARTAYTQLRHSPVVLAGTVLGMLLLFAVPAVLGLAFVLGAPRSAALGLGAWLVMAAMYVPMLRYYGRSVLWAPGLPLVALFYVGATLASAWRYRRGRGGQWKGRVQAAG
ncbi:glycosyltransferase [Massilia horti]|uniref:Glycosyltransferase n=1 Tax=Massilia horti TaxID=2562153 RepID=A0A4Y9SN89_9BURK|nr:glycosyltransferase [Massilia horti]TFW28008.1 glycosyltransferase [Massilia horti]